MFLRVGRRIRITPAGESLLQLSHRVFQDLKDTTAGITDSQESLRGTVRLLGGMTVCLYVFPPLLTELKREHPEIDTLIYGCPHWATVPAIEPLEKEFGVKVVTALQAIIWEGMRLAGVNDKVQGYGRLFREF